MHEPIAIETRRHIPVFQNYVYENRERAKACLVGDLDMVGCAQCGFVWNRAFQADIAVYDSGYENDQTLSRSFKTHFAEMADRVIHSFPLTESISLLEIGCGQGQFLAEIAERAGDRLDFAYGFDPAYRGPLEFGERTKFKRSYASKETVNNLHFRPRCIVSRHTIEHVPDPIAFLNDIRGILGEGNEARLFIETPCVRWILDNCVIQDLFYEHCSLFTAETLDFALESSGFRTIKIDHVFGGQYLWAEAAFAKSTPTEIHKQCDASVLQLAGKRWETAKHRWQQSIQSSGLRTAIWGAGAKGMTFAQITDPDASHIDCIIDINPAKQGKFSPATAHEIVSPPEAIGRGIEAVLVMNPVYVSEIEKLAQAMCASFTIQCVE